ncbi:MAG TPA: SufD family Fe-S cluster assembly protein, partial [Burkholderiaceae bacterium]|nr:SufD family Fe-S cluster assembly protein [Burkholderiaceae bacterium]
SSFNSHSMSFGARLARNDIRTAFGGPHCHTLLNGLYYVNARRHVDHNTLIDHAHPNGISREYYRGILADMGRGVFGGRILVAPGADGTDAVQRSDSLLLSRMARADAKPELEIYADDVSCAHGATVGQIDENAMFYLRTRGLDEVHARNLLTYAFAGQAIDRLDLPVLRQQVAGMIRDRLPGGAMLGDIA